MNRNTLLLYILLVLCTVGVSVLDANIPQAISVFVLYLLPICIASYFLPWPLALSLIIGSATSWLISDIVSNVNPMSIAIMAWNFGARAIVFIAAGAAGSYMRSSIERHKNMAAELEVAIHKIRTLEGTHLVCDTCGRIATNDHRWIPTLDFITENSQATLHSCLCPECLSRMNKNA